MNKKLDNFFHTARSVVLTPSEKSSIKLALVRELEARPRSRYTFSFLHTRYFQLSMTMLLVLLVTGGGVSSAAEGAVPGDWLYAVKVGINESVKDSFLSGAQRAAWEAAKIARRLEETETLATRGELQADTQAQLAASVTRSAERFQEEIAALPEGHNVREVANAKTELKAALKAHTRILNTVARDLPEQAEEVAPVLAVVQEAQGKVASFDNDNSNQVPELARGKVAAPAASPMMMSAPASPSLQAVATVTVEEDSSLSDEDLADTEEQVKELEKLVKNSNEKLDQRGAEQLSERLEAVSEALSSGRGNHAKAIVEETKILLKAKQRGNLKQLDLGL
jgi:hypothetical protein